MLKQYGLLRVILRGLPQFEPERRTGDTPLYALLSIGFPVSFGLSLAGVYLNEVMSAADSLSRVPAVFAKSDVQKAVRVFRQTLKISNDESDEFAEVLAGVEPLFQMATLSLAVRKRFLARPTALGSVELLRALGSWGGMAGEPYAARIESILSQLGELHGVDPAPPPLVTGDDLVALGFRPGPKFKTVLERTYDEQLEGKVWAKEDAERIAIRMMEGI
jgi:poly(A) polymerase